MNAKPVESRLASAAVVSNELQPIGGHDDAVPDPFIHICDDFAPPEVQRDVWDACMAHRWYAATSQCAAAKTLCWTLDLNGDPAVERLWTVAKPISEATLGRRLKVVRQYANGHTFGLGGELPTEVEVPLACTLHYYPMPEWREEWQGETFYRDAHCEVIRAVKPVPNRAVLFDSRIRHAVRAPSRFYGGLRVAVAFELASD